VVATSLNTREQLAAVVSLNCDAAQGVLTGLPARASELEFTRCVFDADSDAAPLDHGVLAARP
jgi:EAL domain-containing protein (putative c-di-GMP-specific phosphodiesterase class I)